MTRTSFLDPVASRKPSDGGGWRAGAVRGDEQAVVDDTTHPFGGPGTTGNVHGGPADPEAFTTWPWLTAKDTPPAHPF